MMIGQYPLTWVINDIFAIILFFMCLFHALRQKNYQNKVFELIMFVFGAGIFEHVGVFITHTYSYDPHRIMMAGAIPLATLLIEAAIVYSSTILFEYLNMKSWMSIWVVGFLCVFQDFSIDPVYVHDRYMFNGVLSGQWNWAFKYHNSFFGIPYQNFTGWVYMTGFYVALLYLGYWLAKKYSKRWLQTATPFLAGLLLIIPLLVFGMFLIDGNSKLIPELTKLVIACLIGIFLMIINWKKMKPINIKQDKIIFTIPLLLQLYNLIVGFGLQIKQAYIPLIVCTIVEICYFGYLYRKGKRSARLSFNNN